MWVQWDACKNRRSVAQRRLNFHCAALLPDALTHPQEPQLRAIPLGRLLVHVKSAPIVFHRQHSLITTPLNDHSNVVRLGVLTHIRQRLLRYPEERHLNLPQQPALAQTDALERGGDCGLGAPAA